MKYFNFKCLIFFFALAMAIPPAWAEEVTICNGTSYSENIPLSSSYATSSATNITQQIIYPKSYLSDLSVGTKIKSIKFYDTSSYANLTTPFSTRNMVVRIGEVPDGTVVTGTDKSSNGGNGTLYNRNLMSTYTEVYTGNPTIDGQELSFIFTEDYTYNGGNLAIEIYYAQGAGNGNTIYWYGVTGTTACSGHYRYSANASGNNKWRVSLEAFLPKMTITYEGGSTTPEIGVDPESLMITDATTGSLNVTGTNISDNITASFTGGTDDWTLTNNPLAAAGGSLDVNYTGRFLAATNNVELSATGATSVNVPVAYQPNLYVVGDYSDGNGWNFSTGTPMTYNNGSYTADITTTNNTFLLISKKVGDGAGWSNEQHLYGPVASGGNETNWELQEGYLGGTHNLDLTNGVHHCIYIPESMAGTYNITVTPPYGISFTRKMEQVATPTFTPAEGTFTSAQSVTIACATDGATIYYTTDGSTPTTSSTEYTGAINVNETTTIKAIAVKNGMTNSEVATATYTINIIPVGQDQTITIGDESDYSSYLPVYGSWYDANQQNQMIYTAEQLGWKVGTVVKAIQFYPRGSIGFGGGSVKLSLATTTSTWDASYSGSVSGPIVAENMVEVCEIAPVKNSTDPFIFTFTTPFTYNGGNLLVEINTVAGSWGSTDFYGKSPSDDWAGYYSYNTSKYVVKFQPKATFTFIAGDAPEAVATPTFTPAAGTYTSAQSVTIACATDGATIYYTTDGTEPSATNGTAYTSAINVSETTTIKAIAIKDGMTNSAVAEAEYIIDIPVDYAVTVSPDGGTINFGTADPENNGSSTRTIVVTNTGLQPVTPTLTGLEAPFSTDYTASPLAAGESVTITITFTPTTVNDFSANATLSFGNGIAAREFTLTGKGSKYDENDHSAIYDYTYNWTDEQGNPRTSSLLETAYEPDQIISMLRKIYMTKEIPGNLYRGYDTDGNLEKDVNGNDWQVTYPAIGKMTKTYSNGSYIYQYNDAYGWNIPTEHEIQSGQKGSYNYKYFDSYEYQPNQDGLTVIMMEMNDNPEGADQISSNFGSTFTTTDSASLHNMIKVLFKSARIITTYKETGTDAARNAGTLFKIDANKLNRFFFLAKGRLRASDNSPQNAGDWVANGDPLMRWKTNENESNSAWRDLFNMAPFYNMFEQFSPVNLAQGKASSDIYQEMINMQSYPVEHDCQSIPFIALQTAINIDDVTYKYGHEFNMYGKDSQSDDCQDVRDMMFFVPKYRMMDHAKTTYYSSGDRDISAADWFVNYHQNDSGATEKYAPTLGLYVIRQNEITGEKQADANVYDLNLSWKSNLLDFLPADEGQYFLYRVITDANGNKSYQPVVQMTESGDTIRDANGKPIPVTLDPNQTTYVDHVAMQETGQEVTYVVQGQDATQFLSLQMSNEESFIIPGTDETLKLTLKLTNDYSRFDPKTERNYYSNELQVTNNMSPYVSADDLAANNATFTIYRYYGEGENEVETPVATLTPVAGQMKLNITWANQRDNSTDAENYYSWINMPNKDAVAYSITGNVVAFDNFRLFDNFYESVADNNHPSQYRYQVEFSYGDQTAHSNKVSVYIHKTDMDVQGYTQNNIDSVDLNHSLNATLRYIDEQVKYSSKQEILRYDAFRWKEGSENERKIMTNSTIDATTLEVTDTEVAPTGEADNGGNQYTLKMDGRTQGSVDINMDGNSTATFEDFIVNQEAGMYYYAPVVETFTGRGDYNTYGAPVQQTGVATIQAKVAEAIISTGSFKVGDEPRLYAHYNVTLDLSQLLIPSEDDPFKDYDLYKVRVWRQVDPNLLNEEVFTGNKVGRNRAERITGDFLMEEVDYNTFSRSAVDNEHQTSLYKLGSNTNLTKFHSNWTLSGSNEIMGTFGAVKLRTTIAEGDSVIDELPMHFIVRAYYTRTANIPEVNTSGAKLANRGVDVAEDQKYYIAEYEFTHTLTRENIITGIPSVVVDRNVSGVTYFNVMGQQSDKPFEGINIVVTHYSDGTTSTTKVLK